MSPVRTRPASSRSLHRLTTLSRPWPSHTYVTAVAMSYPPTGPRCASTATSTDARRSPNTVLVARPASAAWR